MDEIGLPLPILNRIEGRWAARFRQTTAAVSPRPGRTSLADICEDPSIRHGWVAQRNTEADRGEQRR